MSVRILGIDPGTAIVGWAIIDDYGGGRVKHVAHGCIETESTKSDADRLGEIARDFEQIVATYAPAEMGIEQLFYFKNQKTIITVAQARGVLLLCAERAHLAIGEYTPLQVKQAVAGNGRAEKAQVQAMVKTIFHLDAVPRPDDAADALAVAFCHSASRVMHRVA